MYDIGSDNPFSAASWTLKSTSASPRMNSKISPEKSLWKDQLCVKSQSSSPGKDVTTLLNIIALTCYNQNWKIVWLGLVDKRMSSTYR